MEDYLASRLLALFRPRRKPSADEGREPRRHLVEGGYRPTVVGGTNNAHLSWVAVEAWRRGE